MSFLDPITASGPATELDTTGAAVNVDQATPPTAGQVLTATDATHATWQDPTGGGVGGGGDASGLETTGAPVDVAAAAPPVPGQVLMAVDAEHAQWKVPGLHYDPSIRFWIDSSGEATIEPGTWGFVYTTPVGSTGVTVFVVSSLTAPPVDSRFALYVSPSVSVPVTVSLIGASQIMGLDGVLASSITLLPGAMFEWVFYHEDGSALWGLVSETSRTAQYLATADGRVDVSGSASPVAGAVLTAIDETSAEWVPPTDITVERLSTGIAGATHVDLVADDNVEVSGDTEVDGVNVNGKRVLLTSQTTTSQNGTWHVSPTGEWNIEATGLQPALDQFVIVDNGTAHAGEIWVHWDTYVYVPISVGAPLIGGTGITRTGNAFSLASHAASHGRGGSDIVAAARISESSGPTVLDIGAIATGQYLQRSGSNVVGVTAPTPAAHAASHGRGGTDIVAAAQLSESSGPTTLAIGAVADGQFLKRSGTDVVGAAALEQTAIDSLPFKEPVRVVANANIALTGLQTIGSVTLVSGDRVLCVAETTTSQNGIYVASASAWSRATDADSSTEMRSGHLVACTEGTLAETVWMLQTNNPITLGTTGLSYVAVAGQASGTGPQNVKPTQGANVSVSNVYRWAREDHVHLLESSHNGLNGFRISTTTTSGIPTDGTFTNYTIVPYTGNRISVYNGSVWVPMTMATANLALSGQTAGVPLDIFIIYSNVTTVAITTAAWTNATTRATALTLLDGVWVKATNSQHRYIGTILPDSATTFTVRAAGSGSTKAVCGLWNVDNQIRDPFDWTPTFDTWSPAVAATWEIFGGGSGPHIEAIVGLQSGLLPARALAAVNAGAAEASLAVSYDGSLTPAGMRGLASVSGIVPISASASHRPASGTIGVKTVNAIAHGTTTGPVFYGAHGGGQAGLSLDIWH